MGTLFYLISQGFENVWKNKIMFIASVLIISTSMITLGIFSIVAENAKAFVSNMKADQTMIAFLDEGVDEARVKAIEKTISEISGVTGITHETKEEALKNARELYFDESTIDFTEGWEDNNLFTDSFAVNVDDLTRANDIKTRIEDIAGVRNVRFDEDIFSSINKVSEAIQMVVMVVFVLLVAVSLLVISNTIKLVLHSRRKEINIMKYIGATDTFVKTPFIIEGIIVGVVGAYLSWFLTMPMYSALQNLVADSALNFPWVDLSQKILHTNLIIGIGISCIACMISIKKYLKV